MKLLQTTIVAGCAATLVAADATTYADNAGCTSDQMMRYYGTENAGLWGDTWWESGFIMGALADLMRLNPGYGSVYSGTWQTTLTQAPAYGGYTNFIDAWYDDEGWWANGWLSVYDLTQDTDYLNAAITLWNDISGGGTSCGGIYWEKGNTYIASIANELFIYLSASLANRVSSSDKQTYLTEAQNIWDWFFASGVVGTNWLVQDGVNLDGCQVTGDYYSYNQGVILSAAAELYKATGNSTYIQLASNIANAVITKGSMFTNSEGVITDCDDGCDENSELFKGPFFRGLAQLNEVSPNGDWADYITTNAQALWNNDLSVIETNGVSECNTGPDFNGPPGSSFDEVDQVAALACLNAAIMAT